MAEDTRKVLFSNYQGHTLGLLLEQGKLTEIFPVQERREDFCVGDIVLGRVRDIVPHLNAAFVCLQPGERGAYLPLEETAVEQTSAEIASCAGTAAAASQPHTGKESAAGSLCAGKRANRAEAAPVPSNTLRREQDIPVQITAPPVGSKPAKLTMQLRLGGRYCVVGLHMAGLHFSKKLSSDQKRALGAALREAGPFRYGVIVRTESGELVCGETEATERTKELSCSAAVFCAPLLQEIAALSRRLDELLHTAKMRPPYTVLYREEPPFLARLRRLKPAEIWVDSTLRKEDSDETGCFLPALSQAFPEREIHAQEDGAVSLLTLWGLGAQIERALSRRVWLPSGGYLVIERTEALTAIDVNSGKSDAFAPTKRCRTRQERERAVRALNEEAAAEALRQIRLRGLCGMILIDFLNMENKEDEAALLALLRQLAARDLVHTRALDITALGLAELTRKKEGEPLEKWMKIR